MKHGEDRMAAFILVIEDDLGILDATQALLEFEGYSVTASPNPSLVHDVITGSAELPDVIILDVLLSGNDGRSICQDLKSHPRTRHIPVLMVSAHLGVQDSVFQAGADGFLPKPYDIEDLLALIKAHIEPSS